MNPRLQRFCGFCGRRMVPFHPGRYPEYEWLECPRHRQRWIWQTNWLKHEVAIIGDAKRPTNFDRVTGEPL